MGYSTLIMGYSKFKKVIMIKTRYMEKGSYDYILVSEIQQPIVGTCWSVA